MFFPGGYSRHPIISTGKEIPANDKNQAKVKISAASRLAAGNSTVSGDKTVGFVSFRRLGILARV